MKYNKEERLVIGKRIYDNEITKYEAAEQYDISATCARDDMRLYRDSNHLPSKGHSKEAGQARIVEGANLPEYEAYASLSKEELIRALVKARIDQARLKKVAR